MAWATTGSSNTWQGLLVGYYIYVTSSGGGGIKRININTQASESFSSISASTSSVAVYNNNFYFSDFYGPNVYVTNHNGVLIQTITFGRDIKTIAINGNFLYAVTYQGSNEIIRYNLLNNTTNATWGTSTFGTVDIASVYGATVSNNILYLSNRASGVISKINLLTNTATWNWITGIQDPNGSLVYGDYLYIGSYSASSIFRIDLLAASPSVVTVYNLSAAICPIQLNGMLYVLNYGGQIYKTFVSMPASYTLPCFLENTGILTNKGLRPIQHLRKGDLVLTLRNGLLPIDMIGKKEIHHPASSIRLKDQLYRCSKNNYPELLSDLIITGCHSILVDDFSSPEQKHKVIEMYEDTYVTDTKYRLPACIDERASVYEKEGHYTIYHLALENEDYYSNYGIYANGLLVESCSKRYLKELSEMELIE